jgi:hypothetical protein
MVITARPAETTATNAYCSTCLRTRRFFDRRTHVVCETCSKRLEKVGPGGPNGAVPRTGRGSAGVGGSRVFDR